MKLHIKRFLVRFPDSGEVEIDIPPTAEGSISQQVRFDRVNDQTVEVFLSDLVLDEDDDDFLGDVLGFED
jgi:hypothetical protein